jgi:hypothetical protein
MKEARGRKSRSLLAYFLFLRVSYGEFKRGLDTLFLLERAAAGVATAADDVPVSASEAFKAAVVKILIVSFDSVSAAVADETPVCDTSKAARLGMALKASNVVGNPVTLHRIW